MQSHHKNILLVHPLQNKDHPTSLEEFTFVYISQPNERDKDFLIQLVKEGGINT